MKEKRVTKHIISTSSLLRKVNDNFFIINFLRRKLVIHNKNHKIFEKFNKIRVNKKNKKVREEEKNLKENVLVKNREILSQQLSDNSIITFVKDSNFKIVSSSFTINSKIIQIDVNLDLLNSCNSVKEMKSIKFEVISSSFTINNSKIIQIDAISNLLDKHKLALSKVLFNYHIKYDVYYNNKSDWLYEFGFRDNEFQNIDINILKKLIWKISNELFVFVDNSITNFILLFCSISFNCMKDKKNLLESEYFKLFKNEIKSRLEDELHSLYYNKDFAYFYNRLNCKNQSKNYVDHIFSIYKFRRFDYLILFQDYKRIFNDLMVKKKREKFERIAKNKNKNDSNNNDSICESLSDLFIIQAFN